MNMSIHSEKNLRENCFTTVELIISIGMIVVLTGMFLLNYNFQGESRDLTDANHIIFQEIREVQSLVISSSKPPLDCGMSGMPQSYGLQLNEGDDFLDVFVDKDGDNDYDLEETDCTCTDGVTENECIKRIFIPKSIKISSIKINAGLPDESSPPSGWVNFFIDDLSVKMNGENKANIEIKTCIKSDCLANTRKITVNNKGAVEIE